jgi:hypothetical protein
MLARISLTAWEVHPMEDSYLSRCTIASTVSQKKWLKPRVSIRKLAVLDL